MSNENKISKKRVPKKKVWTPPVMDLTLTLEQFGLKIGDQVMLGSGLHEIVSFDASKQDQVQMKSLEYGATGFVRRNIHTVKQNLVKNK